MDGVVTNHTPNTVYSYEVYITIFYFMGGPIIFKAESVNWYEMEGGKPTVYFNTFENYSMYHLRPSKLETW